MTRAQAQDRLTLDQIDYLESCAAVRGRDVQRRSRNAGAAVGWRKSDSIDAYQHEEEAALKRMLPKKESPNVGL